MQNIYEMYHANGNKFGFIVKRESWTLLTAKIVSIEGVKEGQPIPGKPPYFKNQDVQVVLFGPGCRYNKVVSISCPGTYSYVMVNPELGELTFVE